MQQEKGLWTGYSSLRLLAPPPNGRHMSDYDSFSFIAHSLLLVEIILS